MIGYICNIHIFIGHTFASIPNGIAAGGAVPLLGMNEDDDAIHDDDAIYDDDDNDGAINDYGDDDAIYDGDDDDMNGDVLIITLSSIGITKMTILASNTHIHASITICLTNY